MPSRTDSIVGRSRSGLLTSRKARFVQKEGTQSPETDVNVDCKAVTNYFLGFWGALQATDALRTLERYESKRMLKPLRKKYGQWCPPPEVAQALKKPHQTIHRSHLPDTKDARNLRFVLKMLGCSLQENRPFKQFIKARSVRQKRLWMYKYMTPKPENEQIKDYTEPICPTRLRRLYQFFPDRFRTQDNSVYFNNKLITYDESRRVFYFGLVPTQISDESE